MALQIKKLFLTDGTELDASALAYISLTSKGNVQIVSPAGSKMNIEAGDNLSLKPAGKLQFDTNHYTDPADKDEFKIAVICDSKSAVEGLKIECAGLKFVTGSADTARGWSKDTFKMFFKETTGATDTWAKLNMHAASIDLRTRNTGKGTGGGIAVQISGQDSGSHENKFKIETDRLKDVFADAGTADFQGEGGKGIEIGTINALFESMYTRTMRRGAATRCYAVTRGGLVTDSVTGKRDYPTQSDDSKDIIAANHPNVTWLDIINAAAYLKKVGSIPSNGTFVV